MPASNPAIVPIYRVAPASKLIDALALVGMKLVPINGGAVSGQSLQTRLAKLMLEVSVALEDGEIDDLEIARMKRTLIDAGEAIDSYRDQAA